MRTSFSTPRGDSWSVELYGGATRPCRVYVTAIGPSTDMPCELTPSRARELAEVLLYEAGRAEEVSGYLDEHPIPSA